MTPAVSLTAWLNKLGSPKPDLFILGRSQRPFLFRFVIPANPPAPLPPASPAGSRRAIYPGAVRRRAHLVAPITPTNLVCRVARSIDRELKPGLAEMIY